MSNSTATLKTAIIEAVKRILDENEFHYKFRENTATYSMTVGLRGMIKSAYTNIKVLNSSIYISSSLPINADHNNKAQLRRMAEFICRVNFQLRNGGFEFDLNDGEIKYKIFQICEIPPTEDLIIYNLSLQCDMIDIYAPGILRILAGNCDIEEALDRCNNLDK